MQKFCTKCGTKLDDVTGKCPICDRELSKKELRAKKKAEKKSEKKAIKREKWKKLTLKQKFKKICLRFVLILLALLLLFGSGTATLVYFDFIDVPVIEKMLDFFGISKTDTTDKDVSNETEQIDNDTSKELEELDKEIEKALGELGNNPVDADDYFQNNSNVITEIEADSSTNVRTEAEVYKDFIERGFVDTLIETEYSMSGEYHKSEIISNTSSSKHPYYQTTFISENGDVWIIIEINGVVMASPVSYNDQLQSNVQVIISEKDTVTSYDSRMNKFYETIPNESELIVKKVNRIDAETLEKLTFGEIDKL